MITPAQKRALKWFNDNGPCDLFDAKAPSRRIRSVLETRGYIHAVPSKSQFVMYALSERGARALRGDFV